MMGLRIIDLMELYSPPLPSLGTTYKYLLPLVDVSGLDLVCF